MYAHLLILQHRYCPPLLHTPTSMLPVSTMRPRPSPIPTFRYHFRCRVGVQCGSDWKRATVSSEVQARRGTNNKLFPRMLAFAGSSRLYRLYWYRYTWKHCYLCSNNDLSSLFAQSELRRGPQPRIPCWFFKMDTQNVCVAMSSDKWKGSLSDPFL